MSDIPCPKCNSETWIDPGVGWWCKNEDCCMAKTAADGESNSIAAVKNVLSEIRAEAKTKISKCGDNDYDAGYAGALNWLLSRTKKYMELDERN